MSERTAHAPVFGEREPRGTPGRYTTIPRRTLTRIAGAIGNDKARKDLRTVYLGLWCLESFHPSGYFRVDPSEIALFFGMTVRRVTEALRDLDRLGLISWSNSCAFVFNPDIPTHNLSSPDGVKNAQRHIAQSPESEGRCLAMVHPSIDTLSDRVGGQGVGHRVARQQTADSSQQTVASSQGTAAAAAAAAGADASLVEPAAAAASTELDDLRALASELGKRHGIGDVQRWGFEGEAVGELGVEDVRTIVQWQAERTASDSKQGGRWGALFKPGGC